MSYQRTYWIAATLLLFLVSFGYTQPVNDQEWNQNVTISSDAITITCSNFVIPFDVGRVLAEPDPIGATSGEMSQSMKSTHPIKITLQPQSGTADNLATINGCTIDGTELYLLPHDSGDTITITSAGNIIVPGGSHAFDGDDAIVHLVREGGSYRFVGGTGTGGGGISKVITDAVDAASAFSAGNGTNGIRMWADSSSGYIECFLGVDTCDAKSIIPTGNTWGVLDEAETSSITIDDQFNVVLAGNAKETYPIWIDAFAFSADGTLCTDPDEYTINGFKTGAIACSDNDAATVTVKIGMPQAWDAGTLRVKAWVVYIGASPANDYDFQWSAASGGVIDGTYGDEVLTAFDFDSGGSCTSTCAQYQEVSLLSNPITPEGTPAKGQMLRLRGQIDATGTTATSPQTNILFLGVHLLWTADTWSE